MAGKINNKPNAFQKLIHRFLAMKPVSIFMSKVLHHADAFMLHITSERHTFAELVGLPIVQLTMSGARTGIQRTLPLVSIPVDNKLILTATNFGQKHNPGWYYNLKAHPECEVHLNGQWRKYIARETEGDEREKYWQLALSYYAGYEKYEERAAHRRIPVMLLEPENK